MKNDSPIPGQAGVDPNCGLMRVRFDDSTGPTGATWSPVPLGSDFSGYDSTCYTSELTVTEAGWVTVDPTGVPEHRILVLSNVSNAYPDFEGGICAIDPDDYTNRDLVSNPDDLPVSWRAFLEDPTTADSFWLAANVDEQARAICAMMAARSSWVMPDGSTATDAADCDEWQVPGPYMLDYASGTWTLTRADTTGLDNPNILTLDYGGEPGQMSVVYAGTNGSGVYHYRSPLCDSNPSAPWACL